MTATPDVTLTPIPFYEDTLLVWSDPQSSTAYVAPKPMVDYFGLTWQSQHEKLTQNQLFREGIRFRVVPSEGGPQRTMLLERRLVHPWLLSIPVGRVRPQFQEKLLRYQRECAALLDAYFTTGIAVNPRAALADPVPAPPPPREGVSDQTLRELVAAHRQIIAMQQQLLAMVQARTSTSDPGPAPGRGAGGGRGGDA